MVRLQADISGLALHARARVSRLRAGPANPPVLQANVSIQPVLNSRDMTDVQQGLVTRGKISQ